MTWIDVLRDECDRTSQARTAERLGVSPAVVNQALQGKYKGDIENVRARVEGELMQQNVNCPIEGEISKKQCLDNQRRPFAPTNFQRVRLFKACKNCRERRSS